MPSGEREQDGGDLDFSPARDAGSKHGGGDSKGPGGWRAASWEHSEEEGGRDLEP